MGIHKKLSCEEFEAAPFFVMRTPLLSFNEWLAWTQDLPVADDKNHLDQAEIRALLWCRLKAVLARKETRQALYLAAPRVETELSSLDGTDAQPGEKLQRTLVRYFARMAGRSDPFALFAGCSIGQIGDTTSLRIGGQENYRAFSSLDVGFLLGAIQPIRERAKILSSTIVQTNSTLYQLGDKFRFIESYVDPAAGARTFNLTAIQATVLMDLAILHAMQPISLGDLAAQLCRNEDDLSLEEAHEYVEALLDAQVLTDLIEPGVTGQVPLCDLSARLCKIDDEEAQRLSSTFKEVDTALRVLDDRGLGSTPDDYRKVLEMIPTFARETAIPQILQADLIKPAPDLRLGSPIVAAIKEALHLLHQVMPYSEPSILGSFRAGFLDRFEGCEIPLMEALDPDVGVDLGSDVPSEIDASLWLNGLGLFDNGEASEHWGKREAYLLKRIFETGQTATLELTDADIEALETSSAERLPDFLAVKASIGAQTDDELQNGRATVLIRGAFGPSGAEMMGRFCHGDSKLAQAVSGWLSRGARREAGAIVAEIVHLPQGRVGNIICRPVLRDYEITCLGQSGAAIDNQIPISDLTVRVEDGQIILRSVNLARDIVPRLTASHYAPTADLIYYRFLWALQHQEASGLSWNWGGLSKVPFLPRVTRGKIVLSRATWHIDPLEAKPFLHKKGAFFSGLRQLRDKRDLPRHVLLVEGEMELPLDLENVFCADLLEAEIRRGPVCLIEQFPLLDELCVSGPQGRFVHDLLLPLCRTAVTEPCSDSSIRAHKPLQRQRSLAPADGWLTVALYASESTLDRFLVLAMGLLAQNLRAEGLIDGWFFIRFWDPAPHLRIRFRGDPDHLRNKVWLAVQNEVQPYFDTSEVRALRLESYTPEVNRYGGLDSIDEAERFFEADSDMAIALLQEDEEAIPDFREQVALLATDDLLNAFGLDLAAREAFSRGMSEALADEMQISSQTRIALGRQFRELRPKLAAFFGESPGTSDFPMEKIREILKPRASAAIRYRDLCLRLEQSQSLTVPISSVLGSVVHMEFFRLMRTAPRAIEFVTYDLLNRLYKSQLARGVKS